MAYIRATSNVVEIFLILKKKTMPKVYLIAGLSENPAAISNLYQSWKIIKNAAGTSVIYHGRPDMDNWRVVRIKTYNALRTACERENWQNVPLFWSEQGAYKVIRMTRLEINAALQTLGK